jgi:hypothetical protein
MPRPLTLIKINSLILNTVKPVYNGTSAAGGCRFKQVFEFLSSGLLKFSAKDRFHCSALRRYSVLFIMASAVSVDQ